MSRIKSKILIIAVPIVLLCGIFFYCRMTADAVFDETKAVKFRDYAAGNKIEDATLFIGTWLIHIQGMNDEIYEKALDSASDADQMGIYYKSELADGAWFDISDAAGLQDITSQGTIVSEEELGDLWVMYIVGADGVTKEAASGKKTSIFDTPDPYDLYNLPELEPLRIQYDGNFSKDSTGVDKYYYQRLRTFFNLNLRNSVTDECDRQLAGLQSCYEQLQKQEKQEEAETVSALMSKVDARRRAEVFSRLVEQDPNELGRLQEACSGVGYVEKSYSKKQFVENGNVIDAIGDSIQRCQESYSKHNGNSLTEQDSVLGSAEYSKSMQVIGSASGGYTDSMGNLLAELKSLYNIRDNTVADSTAELKLLDDSLLDAADTKYKNVLSKGISDKYRAALANGTSQAARSQLLEDEKTDAASVKDELQYLIEAKKTRMGSKEAYAYVNSRIDVADGFYAVIKQDDFETKARETVEEHIRWLQELASSIADGDSDLKSKMDSLEEKKQELLAQKAEALDKGNLAQADKYDAAIAAVDKDIEAEESRILAKLAEEGASASELSQAKAQLGDTTGAANINRLKDAALEGLANGDNSGFQENIDALSALGAENALKEIRAHILDGESEDLMDSLNQAVADSKNSSLNGQYGSMGAGTGGSGAGAGADGSGAGTGADGSSAGAGTGADESGAGAGADGSGAGTGADGSGAGTGADGSGAGTDGSGNGAIGMTEDALLASLEGFLGGSFDSLDAEGQIIAAAAMNRLGQGGVRAAEKLAQRFMAQCVENNNRFAYTRLSTGGEEYISLKTIAGATGYRYVYSDSKKEATLSLKGKTCKFRVTSRDVLLPGGESEQMKQPVKFQKEPYIAETAGQSYFGCEVEYIDGTDYSACLRKDMSEKTEELLAAIKEGAE